MKMELKNAGKSPDVPIPPVPVIKPSTSRVLLQTKLQFKQLTSNIK